MLSDPLSEKFRRWASLKHQSEIASKEMNRLRDDLMETVIAEGSQDEKGNTHFELPATIDVAGREYRGIKREVRVSTTLNEDRALAMIDEKRLGTEVVNLVPQIDMDALYAAYQRGKLTEEEIDSLFDVKRTYAFKAVSA